MICPRAGGDEPHDLHTSYTEARALMMARPGAVIRGVTAGYFTASGTPLRAGRLLRDDELAETAVISESLAQRLWPGEASAAVVGRHFRQGDVTEPAITIAGVVGDARPGALDRDPPPVIYRPYSQWASGPMTLVVRTALEPSALAPDVRRIIRGLDPDLPILSVQTLREVVASTVAERRFQVTLTALFGLLALGLGAVGLYGVVSFAVSCRTREIGLRLALGATPSDVMRSVFATGLPPVAAGLTAGLAAAIVAARVLRSLLLESARPIRWRSAWSRSCAATAGLACYLPARRAASLDPLIALRLRCKSGSVAEGLVNVVALPSAEPETPSQDAAPASTSVGPAGVTDGPRGTDSGPR